MKTKEYVTIVENPNPRDEVTDGEKYLLEKIRNSKRFEGWTIYEQPTINSQYPDFILAHPEKGIIIIEVKDWNLDSSKYSKPLHVKGENDEYHAANPIGQVTKYKSDLLHYELESYLEATEIYSNDAYAMITPIVYFHKATRERALAFCKNPESYKSLIWGKAELDEICARENKDTQRFPLSVSLPRSKFAKEPEKSMQKLVENLDDILRPSDYHRSRKDPIILKNEQKKLVEIKKGSIRRWGGSAGSGKSVILATKAVEAIKQGQRVLVLTFNITLSPYLRDLCSQQFTEGNRKLLNTHLTIIHYHRFLSNLMNELSVEIPKVTKEESVDERTNKSMNLILKKINENLPEKLSYDSILIDEGQDFTGDWIRFLKNFYTSKGELLVMYDEAQSIYEDKGVWITDPVEIKGIGFRGEVGHLSISHRLPNAIIHQINRLNKLFDGDKQLSPKDNKDDLLTEIIWKNINTTDDRSALIKERVDSILSQKISTIGDIAIITMCEDTGIEVVNAFEGEKPGERLSHVYDMSGAKDTSERREEKWKFQPGKDRLKVSSYHSYKGWEDSHIILLLEDIGSEDKTKSMLDALYISLTRVSAFSESRSFTCINNCSDFNKYEKDFK